MSHRIAGISRKGTALAFAASVLLSVGSPLVAVSSAADNGAARSVSATFGDCKNDNSGLHQGYDCPAPVTSGGGTISFN